MEHRAGKNVASGKSRTPAITSGEEETMTEPNETAEPSGASGGSLAWIPVAERLPPHDERVLYCAEVDGKFRHEVNAGRWDGRMTYPRADGFRACVMDYGDGDGDWEPCTHWMPLPAPPADAK